MNELEAVPVPAEDLTVRRIGKETIILTISGEELHTLDETGTFVWSAIDGRTPLFRILDAVCLEYKVNRRTAGKDLLAFIMALQEKGIISLL